MSAKMLMHPKVVILGYLSAPCVYREKVEIEGGNTETER